MIPRVEVAKRVPLLVARFSEETQEIPLVAGRNVDMTWLADVDTGGVPIPTPSIEHSIVQCQVCGLDLWLGPQQMKAEGTRICYVCLAVFHMLTGSVAATEIKYLNPDEHKIPRRT